MNSPSVNFFPFPNLSTDRLQLRSISENDLHDLYLLRSNENVGKYLGRNKTQSLDDVKRFIEAILAGTENNESVYWAICLKQNDGLAGTICLWNISDEHISAEIGYELLPSFQGLGLMQEAIKRVITFSFETLNFETLEAFSHKDNFSSTRLLEKSSFVHEPERKADENPDLKVYVLKKADWIHNQ